jgi:hypothetical protein
VDFARVEERNDVRVAKVGRRLDLEQEPIPAERRANLGIQHLDGDVPVVLHIAREIHRCHAAAAKLSFDRVVTCKRCSQTLDVGHECLVWELGLQAAAGLLREIACDIGLWRLPRLAANRRQLELLTGIPHHEPSWIRGLKIRHRLKRQLNRAPGFVSTSFCSAFSSANSDCATEERDSLERDSFASRKRGIR